MKSVLISTVMILGLGLAPMAQAGDTEAGRIKAATCMGCHGVPGIRNAYPGYRVPKIGGQHEAYIITALKAYRDRDRSHPTMIAQATSLSDEDMADIAAYFRSLGQ